MDVITVEGLWITNNDKLFTVFSISCRILWSLFISLCALQSRGHLEYNKYHIRDVSSSSHLLSLWTVLDPDLDFIGVIIGIPFPFPFFRLPQALDEVDISVTWDCKSEEHQLKTVLLIIKNSDY